MKLFLIIFIINYFRLIFIYERTRDSAPYYFSKYLPIIAFYNDNMNIPIYKTTQYDLMIKNEKNQITSLNFSNNHIYLSDSISNIKEWKVLIIVTMTNEYKNIHGGNTEHLQECVYYIDPNNFKTIDFKIENLKFFFKTVLIKKNISDIDKNKINIFDDIYVDKFDTNKNLFYKDFTKFLIKNKIEFSDF